MKRIQKLLEMMNYWRKKASITGKDKLLAKENKHNRKRQITAERKQVLQEMNPVIF